MGTPAYMSPEQARGEQANHCSDIFSMGVLMYEMATGRSPFKRRSQAETMNAVINDPHAPVIEANKQVRPDLAQVIERALSKEQIDRYQSAEEMIQELRKVVEQSGGFGKLFNSASPDGVIVPYVPLRPQNATGRAQRLARRLKHRASVTAIAAVVVVAAAIALYALSSSRRATTLTEKDTILIADFVNATGDNVFDGTLKQALEVHLGQSPFLNILSEDRVREALKYMNRPPDERLTKEVVREICRRQGIKAMLAGSIASLGSNYVITLEAINAGTGDVLAREQAEAQSKERVLARLGEAALRLREKLGESLATIERFDVPIEQATTSSLEALKAYSMGREQHSRGKYLEAIPLFKLAVELDPEFALAYSYLSTVYGNAGAFDLMTEFARKALDLTNRASERERYIITARYYNYATGQYDKAIEVLEMWKRAYPRDPLPLAQLANCYHAAGQIEKSVAEAREAIRLDPNMANTYVNLGVVLMRLNRFDEAKEVFEQAIAQGLDATRSHLHLFEIAVVQKDTEEIRRQQDWFAGRRDDYWMLNFQAIAAAFNGQRQQMRELFTRAIEKADRHNFKELAAIYASFLAGCEALIGDCKNVRADAGRALEGVDFESRSFAAMRPAPNRSQTIWQSDFLKTCGCR